MRYKIIRGQSMMKEIFSKLKDHPSTTSSYLGETNLVINQGNSGIAYDPKMKEITMVCEKGDGLSKQFRKMLQGKIKLEKIN